MPELPEVETVMRALEPALTGRVITKIVQNRPNLRVPFPDNLAGRLQGKRIDQFDRRAKYILASVSGEMLVLHLGMSGRILILGEGQDYTPQKHDHLVIYFDDGTRLVFNDPRRFGMVLLVPGDELEAHSAFRDLGPEPLSNNFNGPVLYEALSRRKVAVKEAIMNQKIVVGVGNIYACESLFESHIDPRRPACDVSMDESEALAGNIKSVLLRAIQAGGSTLKDYRHPDDKLGYFQHDFKIYGRENEPCRTCESPVERIVQGGRSTFFCPNCQK
jgi:formamidopyrimidine-DNA glycosylase